MNSTVWIKALITAFIALGTTLITLFSGAEVKAFADVTPVQYAVAAIGAILAGLAVVQAQLSDSPANVRQANEIVSAAANLGKQSGFITPQFGAFVIFCSSLAVAVSGCQTLPETPRQTLLAAYSAATTAANTIEIAKRDGHITADTRDQYLGEVRRARDILEQARLLLANEPAPGSANESDAIAKLRMAQEILIAIQAALAQEQTS